MTKSRGKRRRGSETQRRSETARTAAVDDAQSGGPGGIPSLAWIAIAATVVVVVIAGLVLLRPTVGEAVVSPSPATSGSVPGAAAGDCPTSQPPALAAGETRTVTLATPVGDIAIGVEADLSPIAAGNFVALASCGFYDGTVFHRTPTLQDGTPFVIQGGDGQFGQVDAFDPARVGSGGPGYEIQDEPVTTPYVRGTVAMARSTAPNSVGSQFFIVLDDKDGAILGSANTYQIIGRVTSGMETADTIYQASGGVELPDNPIPITTATVTNP
jgi:cyclophilin family peptidyl-prolyl cis-trans isomerase